MKPLALSPLLALLLLGGCSAEKVTEIVVSISSDLKVPEELAAVQLIVKRFRGTSSKEVINQGWDLGDPLLAEGLVSLPITFGLIPGGEPDHLLQVTVKGLRELKGQAVITREARLGYVRDRILHLRMNLLRSCLYLALTNPCEVGMTCGEQGCQPIDVEGESLENFDPNRPLDNVEAGVPDRGPPDLRRDVRLPDRTLADLRQLDLPRPDRPHLDLPSDRTTLDLPRLDQPSLDQAKLDQAKLDQAKPDQAKPDQAKPDQAKLADLNPPCITPAQTPSCSGGWCQVPAGCFIMGSPEVPPEPCRDGDEWQHPVTLTHPLEVAETEVTEQQFDALMGYNPSASKKGNLYPVENVTWAEAQAYCAQLSASKGFIPCFTCSGTGAATQCTIKAVYDSDLTPGAYPKCPGYRLPSEAEQEYIIRGGTTTAFYNGPISSCTTDPNAGLIAWYSPNAGLSKQPVKGKLQNPWGLYDTTGNVLEWTQDGWWNNLGTVAATDPVLPSLKGERALHGAFYQHPAQYVRSANRMQRDGTARYYYIGFRCVRSLN